MKRLALCFATIAVFAVLTNSATASDFTKFLHKAFGTNRHAYYQAEQRAHAQHHADLEYRAIEREFVSQAAHQQPLTHRQDLRLHQQLDRAAYLDAVEHRTAHATQAYSPQFNQVYRGVPNYGPPFRSSQYGGNAYGTSPYGVSRYPSSPYQSCSPFARY